MNSGQVPANVNVLKITEAAQANPGRRVCPAEAIQPRRLICCEALGFDATRVIHDAKVGTFYYPLFGQARHQACLSWVKLGSSGAQTGSPLCPR